MYNIARKIKRVFKNPQIILEKILYTRIGKLISTERYLKIQYRAKLNKKLNLKDPQTYSEKIQYLKIRSIDSSIKDRVDKYEVRKYIKNTIGEEYLIPLIAVFNSPAEIDISKLPDKFVLKCTHDSQSIVFCWDKDSFNVTMAIKKLRQKFKNNAYDYSREYFYRDIPKRIVCEEIIGDGRSAPNDYKFMCFNGKVHLIIVDYDRFTNHSRDFYDAEWNKVNITTDCPMSNYNHPKPKMLPKMIELSEKLSSNYKHVRVDLYCINNKIYFGELTFMPWAGLIKFYPDEWNYKLGKLINIDD